MSEYIEREKVYEMLNDLGGCGAEPESWEDGWDKAINAAIKELEDIPTADVALVVHGHWVSVDGDVIFACSICENEVSTSWDYVNSDDMFSYCPCCGAKMEHPQR